MAESGSCKINGGPYKGKRIDGKGNVKCKGELLVTSFELQFSREKRKEGKDAEKEIFPFKEIKSYGSHENVLSVRMGGATIGHSEVHFKLKEAVVVKEFMDREIRRMKRPSALRVMSFDEGMGFYGMNNGMGGLGMMQREEPAPLSARDTQLGTLLENPSYMDMDKSKWNVGGYSRPKLGRSISTGSTDSSVSSPGGFAPLYSSNKTSPGAMPGAHDNPVFQLSPQELCGFQVPYQVELPPQIPEIPPQAPQQYVELERGEQSAPRHGIPPPPPPTTGKKKYSSLDLPTMEALEKLKLN